jgi:hypothetical protein
MRSAKLMELPTDSRGKKREAFEKGIGSTV